MYTRFEVCEKMGITRQAIRGYKDIGLLPPTEIAPNGQWMYDDLALSKLGLIQILLEADYTRKEIKNIFDSEADIYDELSKAIERLDEKKKRIEGFVTTLNIMTSFRDNPNGVKEMLTQDLSELTSQTNFAGLLDDMIQICIEHGEAFQDKVPDLIPFIPLFDALAEKARHPESQECQNEVIKFLQGHLEAAKTIVSTESPEDLEELNSLNVETSFGAELAQHLIDTYESKENIPFKQTLYALHGPKKIEAVIKALQVFIENHPLGETETR